MKIALIGYPLKKSLSKYLYKKISEVFRLDISFLEIETKKPLEEIEKLKKEKFNGFFVTIPYKKLLFDIVEKDETVEKTKNLNCIRIENDKIIATNTDYQALRELISLKNIKILSNTTIIGSGSAALTSYTLLKELGSKNISIITRNHTKEEIINQFKTANVIFLEFLKNHKTEILINATPLGMYYKFPEIDFNFKVIIDFAYKKGETTLIKKAKKDSKIFIEGKEILVMQAIYGLKHIAGIDLKNNYEIIYNLFLKSLKEKLWYI